MNRRYWILIGVLAVVGAAILWMVRARGESQVAVVGITQIATHPALDGVRSGIVEGLAQRGFVEGENIRILYRNANGDGSLTLPIAQSFVQQGASVLIPISTPSALSAARSTTTIPVVFGGVTDPLGVGLVKSMERPGANVTGTSDRWPFEEQIRLIRELMPSMRRLGMLYRPGDDVSAIAIRAVTEVAPKYGITVVAQPVSDPSQIYSSAVRLLQSTDAVYTGLDHLVVENLESLLRASMEVGKPVLGGDEGSVERGALAALSIDMHDLGLLTGQMAADVLEGAKPDTMAVRVLSEGKLVVNRAAAQRFLLPDSLVSRLGGRYVESVTGN
jgi:putative ABC transport system substrate-binding protein